MVIHTTHPVRFLSSRLTKNRICLNRINNERRKNLAGPFVFFDFAYSFNFFTCPDSGGVLGLFQLFLLN